MNGKKEEPLKKGEIDWSLKIKRPILSDMQLQGTLKNKLRKSSSYRLKCIPINIKTNRNPILSQLVKRQINRKT